jgi:hypothetical protein
MTRAAKQWTKNLFIVSSLSIKGLFQSLTVEARQAHLSRDYARLEAAGEKLKEIAPEVGRYFSALAISRQGYGNKEKALREFECLKEYPLTYAPSLTAIAGLQIARGDVDETIGENLLRAAKSALDSKDILTAIQAHSLLSVIQSVKNDHQNSLQILWTIKPMIDRLGRLHDAVRADFNNSVAYELAQLGNHKAAQEFVNISLNSPHLSAYPEWLETAREIHQHVKVRSLLYAMGEVEGQIVYKKKPSNVLPFRPRQQQEPFSLPLCFKMPDGSDFHICDYPIEEMPILENCVKVATARKAQRNIDNATK